MNMVTSESYLKEVVKTKLWFKNSDQKVRNNILEIPDTHEGSLHTLLNMPDEVADKALWRIERFIPSTRDVFVEAILKSKQTNQEFTFDFLIPKDGRVLSSYGAIALTYKDKLSYLCFPRAMTNFSDITQWQPVEAYFPSFSNNNLFVLPKNIQKDLEKMLGESIEVSKFVDLGYIFPDALSSPKLISLFVAVIKISKDNIKNGKILNLVKTSEIDKVASSSNNGILLSLLAKIKVLNIFD